jgi:hypothetical protein
MVTADAVIAKINGVNASSFINMALLSIPDII